MGELHGARITLSESFNQLIVMVNSHTNQELFENKNTFGQETPLLDRNLFRQHPVKSL